MFRFLHTADWQIGMMASGLGLAAEKVRAARIESLKNLMAIADDRKVDAILMAGDQFEGQPRPVPPWLSKWPRSSTTRLACHLPYSRQPRSGQPRQRLSPERLEATSTTREHIAQN